MTDTRRLIRTAVADAVIAEPWARALWEAGSAAFDRADAWSDLDLYLLVDDGQAAAALAAVETALDGVGGIEHRYRVPEPTTHGHTQCFYRVAGAPFAVVDLLVMERSAPGRFDEAERHGRPHVLFDHHGDVTVTEVDRVAARSGRRDRLRLLIERFELFQPFVTKEVLRDNALGAVEALHAYTLRPLLEVLGMLHIPDRWDYGAHYATLDFPAEVVARLERLWYPAGVAEVEPIRADAAEWFHATVALLEATGDTGEPAPGSSIGEDGRDGP